MSNMEKHLFNLKFAAKELNRNAKKCDKEEKAEKAKIKKIISTCSSRWRTQTLTIKEVTSLQLSAEARWIDWIGKRLSISL